MPSSAKYAALVSKVCNTLRAIDLRRYSRTANNGDNYPFLSTLVEYVKNAKQINANHSTSHCKISNDVVTFTVTAKDFESFQDVMNHCMQMSIVRIYFVQGNCVNCEVANRATNVMYTTKTN